MDPLIKPAMASLVHNVPSRIDIEYLLRSRTVTMTDLLKKAFEKASQLPAEEQDRFGAWMLVELNSEEHWDELFAQSQDMLARMADEALAEHRSGKTIPLDPDNL
jgi:hypothetical protein